MVSVSDHSTGGLTLGMQPDWTILYKDAMCRRGSACKAGQREREERETERERERERERNNVVCVYVCVCVCVRCHVSKRICVQGRS
jgi:hypothetical protein